MVGFFFQDLVSVDVEISQVKRFDNVYELLSERFASLRFVHNPIFCRFSP